jgi:hypothetical protein
MTDRPKFDEKEDAIRRFGMYFGPVILASIAGNALYGFALGGPAINIGSMPLFLHVMFACTGVFIAWRLSEPLGRIAWVVFALHQEIAAVLAFRGARMVPLWSLLLSGLFAGLVTASGVRNTSRRVLLISVGIFLAASVAVFGLRYYSDELLGNHSVLR